MDSNFTRDLASSPVSHLPSPSLATSRVLEAQQSRITEVELKCKYVGIYDNSIVKMASRFYLRALECEPTTSDVSAWLACSIWVATQSQESKIKEEISLTQLLQLCHIKLVEFGPFLHRFVTHFEHDLSPRYLQEVKEFKQFLFTNIGLFQNYEKMFYQVMNYDAQKKKRKRASGSDSPARGNSHLFGCGWLLFLTAKSHFRLVSSETNLDQLKALLCCVIRFLRGAQVAKLDGAKNGGKIQEDGVFVQVGSTYQKINDTLSERVHQEVRDKFYVFLSELCGEKDLACSSEHSFDILSDLNLIKNSYHLSEQYDKLLKSTSHSIRSTVTAAGSPSPPPSAGDERETHGFWLDERLFLDEKFRGTTGSLTPTTTRPSSLTPSPSLYPSPSSFYSTQDRQQWLSEKEQRSSYVLDAFSPLSRSPVAQPPVKILRNVEAVSWLAGELRSQPHSTPSLSLQKIFTSCPHNPLFAIMEIVKVLSAKITFQSPTRSSTSYARLLFAGEQKGESASCPKRDMAQRLFWHTLGLLCQAESSRIQLSPQNAATKPEDMLKFLQNGSFHTCLLACCYEIVIYAYREKQLHFPHVLQAFSITSWDFVKMIESFVRQCPTLPRSLKTHLREIEFSILSEHAWRNGEPLAVHLSYPEHLKQVQTMMNKRVNEIKHKWDFPPDESVSSLHSTSIPLPPAPTSVSGTSSSAPSSELSSPSNSSAPPIPKDSRVVFALELFFRKLLGLVADRLYYLCGEGQLATHPHHIEVIWVLFLHVVSNKIALFFNRHVDTILLSCIYTVLKMTPMVPETLFTQILKVYLSRWSENTVTVTRRIYAMESGVPHLDIFKFYNQIFLCPPITDFRKNVLKPRMVFLERHGLLTSTLRSTMVNFLPRREGVSPRQVGKGVNIYLSPLRHGPGMMPERSPLRPPSSLSLVSSANSTKSKNLYLFGQSPTSQLMDLNRIVAHRNSHASFSTPRRLFPSMTTSASTTTSGTSDLNQTIPISSGPMSPLKLEPPMRREDLLSSYSSFFSSSSSAATSSRSIVTFRQPFSAPSMIVPPSSSSSSSSSPTSSFSSKTESIELPSVFSPTLSVILPAPLSGTRQDTNEISSIGKKQEASEVN